LLEDLQLLRTHLRSHLPEPGDVTAGSRESGDIAATDRVAVHDEDDRHCVRRLPCGGRLGRRHRDEHIYFEAHQLRSEPREAVKDAFGEVVFDGQVLAFDPSEVPEALLECLRVPGGGWSPKQHTDLRQLRTLLAVRGEGRGEEAAGHARNECPSVDHSIT
jgi:hypothetical protein